MNASSKFITMHSIAVEIFESKPQISTSWWRSLDQSGKPTDPHLPSPMTTLLFKTIFISFNLMSKNKKSSPSQADQYLNIFFVISVLQFGYTSDKSKSQRHQT